MKTLVTIMLLLCAAHAEARCAVRAATATACTHHSPQVIVAERTQLAQPGDTVTNTITLRNTDACDCPSSCFQLSTGYHPPNGDPAPANSLRVSQITLLQADGSPANPACLAPGDELHATLGITLGADQDPPGYITPVVFARRQEFPCYSTEYAGWGAGCFEGEGGALCVGMDYFQCRAFVYPPGESE